MSTQTPRRPLPRPRPSLINSPINTASSPNLGASYTFQHPPLPNPQNSGLSASAVLARKASLNQLTSGSLSTIPDGSVGYGLTPVKDEGSSPFTMAPTTPAMNRILSDGTGDRDIDVGDLVDVPGGMHGTVKFVGNVRGKKGTFAGVELSKEWAPRGKNDGDVDGIRYFTTSVPGSGIFLPLNRASKRASPTLSSGSYPPTPTTPSLGSFNIGGRADNNTYTPPTPSMSKFSQSVGPGRAASPQFKPRSRPSLPRPESPLRKAPTFASTPAGRPSLGGPQLSKSTIGGSRYAPSPTPGRFGASLRGRKDSFSGDPGKKLGYTPKPGMKTPGAARPGSRSQSRLGPEASFDEDPDTTPIGVARTNGNIHGLGVNSPIRRTSAQEEDVQRLKATLGERDKQLKEQASSLAEMENSFAELQSLLPSKGSPGGEPRDRGSGLDDADAGQLRLLLREKNEKIGMLTAEFDVHRADFRSTIDTLELASTETERVYEKRVDGLLQEVRELQNRGEDVESVALQLKQLEELVQELEEGLEDARRGEAEARGEVEFLRGEVERGRSELRREREKAAAALKGAGAAVDGRMSSGGSKEVEQRDDEIRGLKAIIHSLSRDSVPDMGSPKMDNRRVSKQRNGSIENPNGYGGDGQTDERVARERLEREIKELEGLVKRKSSREEELEREVQRLRNGRSANKHASAGSNGISERTVIPTRHSSARDSKGTVTSWRDQALPEQHRQAGQLESMAEGDNHSSETEGSALWCEICETGGHDILICTNMFGNQAVKNTNGSPISQRTGRDIAMEGIKGLSVSSPHDDAKVAPLSPMKKSPATPRVHRLPNPTDEGMVAGKESGVIDGSKWCALCERDGHESVDCPFEDAY
ncbi:MAG: hypothetical protein M1830_001444 [Pleopsidium flavum]|nr:MAG: hypothetical protein M1830_001444 [Pleopsidium flavum]